MMSSTLFSDSRAMLKSHHVMWSLSVYLLERTYMMSPTLFSDARAMVKGHLVMWGI